MADCLPDSFAFVVDDLVSTSLGAGAVWHVENDGATLPFTPGVLVLLRRSDQRPADLYDARGEPIALYFG